MEATVTNAQKLRRIKEFAEAAGVTVRTLHLYDQIGLLEPAALSEAGYRLYGEAELERLEHILALRFLGFTLEQIKELLRGTPRPLAVALQMQRDLIARRKRRLESALAAIDEALRESEPAGIWPKLRTIIEVFNVQNDWDWTKNYYSEAALEQIEANRRNTAQEAMERGQRDWASLIAEVEDAASRGIDPSSEEARALTARWRGLIAQFTQGNDEIQRGLNRLWSDATHWPSDFKRPWSDAADAFIKASARR